MNSILTSTKKRLGMTEEYECFDEDIIAGINTVLATLNQIGVGPPEGFAIEDKNTEWSEFVSDNNVLLNLVKTYVYLKVRLVFDPPQSSAVMSSIDSQIKEIEWRIYTEAEHWNREEECQNG